jgi:integrase
MKLFNAFCSKAPQAITREDALAYRDFLLHEQNLAPSTVANKIGFVGTLINSGRNSSQFAKHLPHNPFENIKIKEAKRGKADKKRLPFSDAELKSIFGSTIYTEGVRPEGGAGEAAAWMPAVAYLTGMRLEEIALLKASQFHVDAKSKVFHNFRHLVKGPCRNAGMDDSANRLVVDSLILTHSDKP